MAPKDLLSQKIGLFRLAVIQTIQRPTTESMEETKLKVLISVYLVVTKLAVDLMEILPIFIHVIRVRVPTVPIRHFQFSEIPQQLVQLMPLEQLTLLVLTMQNT